MIYLGVDPGARWTGIAVLRDEDLSVETMVIDGDRDLYEPLDVMHRYFTEDQGLVAAEDFRLRVLGHQAGSSARTPRLLGAIEWEVRAYPDWSFCSVPAGNALLDLGRLGLDGIIASWRENWPEAGDARWNHGLSAWRVLGLHLARTAPALLFRVRAGIPSPVDPPEAPPGGLAAGARIGVRGRR